MAKRVLKHLGDLESIDRGEGGRLFDEARRLCLLDLQDRASVDAARQIVITLSMRPEADQRGELTGVGCDLEVKTKLPAYRTGAVGMMPVGKGGQATGLLFNDLTSDVRQGTLDELPSNAETE